MNVEKLLIAFLKLSKEDQRRVKRSIDAMLAEPEPQIGPPPTGPDAPGGPPK